eukprot:4505207-Amphidinium_carterae.1
MVRTSIPNFELPTATQFQNGFNGYGSTYAQTYAHTYMHAEPHGIVPPDGETSSTKSLFRPCHQVKLEVVLPQDMSTCA